MDGVLILDKPKGITSQRALAVVKRVLKTKKAGYTGTLDPFATGTLPMCLGEATKIIPFMDEEFKSYEAHLLLGVRTDTLDITGKVLSSAEAGGVSEDALLGAFCKFTGDIWQIPPMFSALKVGGERLYAMARRGEEIERKPRPVTIAELRLLEFSPPTVKFSVTCSRGTYVRSLGADIGDELGCGGCLAELRRTRSGAYSLEQAVSIENVENGGARLMSISEALANLRQVTLARGAEAEVRLGKQIIKSYLAADSPAQFLSGERLRVCDGGGALIAVAEATLGSSEALAGSEEALLKLLRVFY
ncbi:MAG: tRNA pseudouridine(55) synthase TruB [Deltaproteobacteria bacterium]